MILRGLLQSVLISVGGVQACVKAFPQSLPLSRTVTLSRLKCNIRTGSSNNTDIKNIPVNLLHLFVLSLCSVYLCSADIFGSIIIPAHAEHILCAVVELREAIELTIAVVNGRLVDTIKGRLGHIGAVEKWLQNLPTLVKVSCASQMEPLRGWTDLILQVCGQARVQKGRLCRLTDMLI